MRKAVTLALGVWLLLLPHPTWASDGEIGLFFTEGGDSCAAEIPCGQARTLFVYAVLDGASLHGITSAEFGMKIGVDGDPDLDWAFSEQFVPNATIALGHSFDPPDERKQMLRRNRGRGLNMAFDKCMPGRGGMVSLETVQIVNGGCSGESLTLLVTNHDRSSNRFFQCPLFTLCDAPTFTKVCIGKNKTICRNPWPPFANDATCSTSGMASINSGAGPPQCVVVGVAQSTWGRVKEIFRE